MTFYDSRDDILRLDDFKQAPAEAFLVILSFLTKHLSAYSAPFLRAFRISPKVWLALHIKLQSPRNFQNPKQSKRSTKSSHNVLRLCRDECFYIGIRSNVITKMNKILI